MKPLATWLLTVLAGAGIATGLVLQVSLIRTSHHPLSMTPWLTVMFLLLGLWLLLVGAGIRKLKKRSQTWVTPVLAGRTALLARAVAPLSSFFAGMLAGIAIASFARSWVPFMTAAAWLALAAAVAATFAAVAALLVERWASLGDGSDGQSQGQTESDPRGALGEPG